MRKFILIDQSIASLSGHHYEYAVHVLEAAHRAGYATYLATNRRFRDRGEHTPWAVLPAYTYGFWAAQSSAEWEKHLAAVRSRLHRAWFRLRCRLRFSSLGVVWAARENFAEFLLAQPLDRARLLPILAWTPLVVLYKLLRFFLLLLLLPLAALGFGLRALFRSLLARPLVRQALHTLFHDLADLAQIPAYFVARRQRILEWLREFRSLRRFAADTAALFRRIPLAEDDLVFIPTISVVEMMGLRLFLDRHPALPPVSWHLLFRRDLYRGREADYARQDPWVSAHGEVFRHFQRGLTGRQRILFYTDTAELTAQYNRLGAALFHTVPIPHTRRSGSPHDPPPLRLIYVGDARREKGFHLLPHLVEELWSDYVAPGKIAFRLQSNYNVPQGEPEAVLARAQLETYPPDCVELLKNPLTSAQYQELLLSGDINLLLYDPENYYARSSGILVESLAAGMPVIVPAASWLARQFLAERYAWLDSLRDQLPVLHSLSASQLRWRRHGQARPEPAPAGEFTVPHEEPRYAEIRVPPGASLLLLSCEFGPGWNEGLFTLEPLDALNQPLDRPSTPLLLEGLASSRRAIHAVPLSPDASRLRLGVRGASPGEAVLIRSLRVDFLTSPHPVPLSAVGVAYHSQREITPLVRELIDHYPHYRRTAAAFADHWLNFHNAAGLVARLASAAESRA